MARGGKDSYYAVQKGRAPGVYRTWAECEANIKGFPGQVFKKFASEREAREFLLGDGYAGTKKDGGEPVNHSPQPTGHDPYASRQGPPLSIHHPQPPGHAAQQSHRPPQPFNHSPYDSTHPYLPALPRHHNSSSNKRNQAPAPAKELGKRRTDDYDDGLAPSKRAHVDPVFPPPHSAAAASSSGSGSKRKTVVYCDGSSIGNGKKGARAGWGVFFEDPELKHLNESRRLPGPVQTNNRAELTAIIRAIQLCPDDGRQLVILTDSRYSMDAVTKWLPGWKKNGYKTSSGGPVQNLDLIMQLEHELKERYPHPKLEYVKAHAGIEGNETVDRMAKFGASLPIEDAQDLNKRSTATEGFVKHEELGDGFVISVSVTPNKGKR